nr:MFS transporter [Vibrio viridaestus]
MEFKQRSSRKALAVYKKIYPNLNEEEANWIFQEKTAMKGDDSQPVASGKRLANPVMKYIMIIGCTIAVLQQITGANVMMYYAPLVLQTAETTKDMVFFQTIFIGLFNAIGAFIGMVLFDHFGRLPMMKIGTWGCIACLLLVSYGMYTGDTGYITVVSVVTFMVFFAIGWGAGTWVLVSEIFPAQIRGIGMGISVSMMWVFNFIIMQIFPLINQNDYLQSHFHGAFPMWIFVGFNLFCLWFLTKFVPETKGLSLEEIERTMASRLEAKTKRDSKVVTSH